MKDILENKIYISDLQRVLNSIDLSKLQNEEIVITGGLGLIGSTIVDLLYISGIPSKIYVPALRKEQFDNRYGKYKKIVFIPYNALEPFEMNITPAYIIHGAGLASPDLYTQKPVETVLSNFNGVLGWLKFAEQHDVKRILYISSSEVYGNKETNDPFKEGIYGKIEIDSIRSSYSIAKRAAEMICKSYTEEYGVDTVIVRPGHIYGPTASIKDRRISSDFAFKAARGEKLEIKSSGMQKRSYCYSIDSAVQILTVLLKGESGQAYNIGHDEITSIRRMAEILAKAGNVDLRVAEPTEEEKKAFNPMSNSALDNCKVKKLGYRDSFSVKEGLTHTVEILKEIIEEI